MTRHRLPPLFLIAAVLLVGGCRSRDRIETNYPRIEPSAIPVTWGFGGPMSISMALDDAEWAEVTAFFQPPLETPAREREAVAHAVSLLEQAAGRRALTHQDLARSVQPAGLAGQLDCVDESTNTTAVLHLLEDAGLLRHHVVLVRAFRNPLVINTHFSGQLRETATGERWVIDSWFRESGAPPIVQRHDEWVRGDVPEELRDRPVQH